MIGYTLSILKKQHDNKLEWIKVPFLWCIMDTGPTLVRVIFFRGPQIITVCDIIEAALLTKLINVWTIELCNVCFIGVAHGDDYSLLFELGQQGLTYPEGDKAMQVKMINYVYSVAKNG